MFQESYLAPQFENQINTPDKKKQGEFEIGNLFLPFVLLLLENYPPKILSGPTEPNVTVNTTVSITVTAEDPNNDSLTFSVTGSLPTGAEISTTESSVTLTWNVTTEQVNN